MLLFLQNGQSRSPSVLQCLVSHDEMSRRPSSLVAWQNWPKPLRVLRKSGASTDQTAAIAYCCYWCLDLICSLYFCHDILPNSHFVFPFQWLLNPLKNRSFWLLQYLSLFWSMWAMLLAITGRSTFWRPWATRPGAEDAEMSADWSRK